MKNTSPVLESKRNGEVNQYIDPVGYHQQFFKSGTRPCGRKLYSFRKITCDDLNGGTLRKSLVSATSPVNISNVRLNAEQTQIHVKIGAYLCFNDLPKVPSQSDNDIITVSVEIPKQVTNYIHDKNGPCINLSHYVASLLESVLNSDDCLQRNQLFFDHMLQQSAEESSNGVKNPTTYLVSRKARWRLEAQVYCEAYDGNFVDYCVLAVVAALRKAALPVVMVVKEKDGDAEFHSIRMLHTYNLQQLSQQEKANLSENADLLAAQLGHPYSVENATNTIKLHLKHLPLTITFSKFSDTIFILDPSKQEEMIGVNFSVYNLVTGKGKITKSQPLNISYCQGITFEVFESLQKNIKENLVYVMQCLL